MTMSTLEAARALRAELGAALVPVPPREKAPALRGWQKLQLEEAELSNYFGAESNIGVLLGLPSGGLVDVDLDSTEAVAAAPLLLPPSNRIHGRLSRRSSHWWYRCHPTPRTEKWRDPLAEDAEKAGGDEKAMLVELRSTGAQTIVPPSIHPCGERLAWECAGDPASVDAETLRAACARLATAALLARHWPRAGVRHDLALALSGFLLRGGIDGQIVSLLVEAAARAAGDLESSDRRRTAEDTAAALAAGRAVTGAPTLRGFMPDQVIAKVAEWLGLRAETTARRASAAGLAPWPRLAPEALYGLAGRIVAAIDPYTEADPVATLAHLLAAVGNLIGPGAHACVQHDRHPCRFNVALVGRTGKGRKGLAWSTPRYLLAQVEERWARNRIRTGLSSGEGLIYNVRDPRWEKGPIRKNGHVAGYEELLVDEGEPDKRLLIIEPELAITLKVIGREKNTLSGIIRQAWDSGDLGTLTKNNPTRATGAHVSIIGHITEEEVRRYLTETERANGFANRFLWLLVRRSKALPEGDAVPDQALAPLVEELRRVLDFVRSVERVGRDAEARAIWAEVYPRLSEGEPGLVGAILNRADAQVLRLSVIYAVLDCSPVVGPAHLYAALAVWDYAEASARRIFGNRLGAPLADMIFDALLARGPLTETAISDLFGRNRPAAELDAALDLLLRWGRVRTWPEATGGRPVTWWAAVVANEKNEINEKSPPPAAQEEGGPPLIPHFSFSSSRETAP